MTAETNKLRVAAVGDVHIRENSHGALKDLLAQVNAEADVLVLCGDLTEHGLVRETEVLAEELRAARVPVVAVLGNHDYESELETEVCQILTQAGVEVLDGDSVEIEGVAFAGVKGFCGGFGARIVPLWGEKIMKQYVHEGINEALKLERALSNMAGKERLVVAMHFAPIPETLAGEHPEIFTYLGNSRLAEAIDRFPVTVAFHGHAHHGFPEGKTAKGVPVYNTALPLMRQHHPERPFTLIEV
jgi:Icc-related predicted phosphoesterase